MRKVPLISVFNLVENVEMHFFFFGLPFPGILHNKTKEKNLKFIHIYITQTNKTKTKKKQNSINYLKRLKTKILMIPTFLGIGGSGVMNQQKENKKI